MQRGPTIHSARIQNRTGERAQFTGTAEGYEPYFEDGEKVFFETDNSYVTKKEGEIVRLLIIKPLRDGRVKLYGFSAFVTSTDY